MNVHLKIQSITYSLHTGSFTTLRNTDNLLRLDHSLVSTVDMEVSLQPQLLKTSPALCGIIVLNSIYNNKP